MWSNVPPIPPNRPAMALATPKMGTMNGRSMILYRPTARPTARQRSLLAWQWTRFRAVRAIRAVDPALSLMTTANGVKYDRPRPGGYEQVQAAGDHPGGSR